MRLLFVFTLLFVLAACDVPEWLGNDDAVEKKLPGERIAVLDYRAQLITDPMISDDKLTLPPARLNRDFLHETKLQELGIDQLAVRGLELQESASVGEGYGFETPVIPQPVIAGELVFAMDARGYISAHKQSDIDEVLWRSDAAVKHDEPEAPGGGLSIKDGVLFVTTGYGDVLALTAADGSLRWSVALGLPLRAPATPGDKHVFAISIDNQLHALNIATGEEVWTHAGIRETAVWLGSMTPAYHDGIVVAGYTSGELVGIRADDGFVLWSDTLVIPRRTSASAGLTGIDATPVIRDGVVYAISNNGLMAANLIGTGRGVWDMELASWQTPWIAGDYIIVLSADGQLAAINRANKAVKWVTDLQREDEKRLPHYTAPLVVNSAVFVVNDIAEARVFDLNSGREIQTHDVADDVRVTPVVARGSMYLLDADAVLTRYE